MATVPSLLPNISTHILDTAKGRPADGIRLQIFACIQENAHPLSSQQQHDIEWDEEPITECVTNHDGRGKLEFDIQPGLYKMVFYVAPYFERSGTPAFYPRVDIIFRITDPSVHYHVPLLLSPFGYSTYRGS